MPRLLAVDPAQDCLQGTDTRRTRAKLAHGEGSKTTTVALSPRLLSSRLVSRLVSSLRFSSRHFPPCDIHDAPPAVQSGTLCLAPANPAARLRAGARSRVKSRDPRFKIHAGGPRHSSRSLTQEADPANPWVTTRQTTGNKQSQQRSNPTVSGA